MDWGSRLVPEGWISSGVAGCGAPRSLLCLCWTPDDA